MSAQLAPVYYRWYTWRGARWVVSRWARCQQSSPRKLARALTEGLPLVAIEVSHLGGQRVIYRGRFTPQVSS